MGLKICVSTCVKKKEAVYVVSISAGKKERNTLGIKIIVINDNNNNNNNKNNNNNNKNNNNNNFVLIFSW